MRLAVGGCATNDSCGPRRILGPSMRNELRPLFDRVVIKELDPDRIRRSGLSSAGTTSRRRSTASCSRRPGMDWWQSRA